MTRLGNPRPTRSVILPYKESKFQEAIDLYEKSGRKAQQWQIDMMKDIMAVNEDGLWTHTKFGYSLPRRNGKNELVVMRELWALKNGEEVMHTAHRISASHSAWEKLCYMLDKAGVEYKSIRAKGQELIELEDGGRVQFRTRTSNGGLGEGMDLMIIDEAQEYTDDQESSLKYVVTSSQNPQTILLGTPPTAVSAGTVFPKFRKAVLNGDKPDNGWAEWGVDEQTDVHDVEAWYLTNPSLGSIFTERSIRDEIGPDTDDFNIQRLGLWISYNQKSAITAEEWGRLAVKRLPKLTSKLYVGIKYGNDGANVAMSIAVKSTKNRVFIESIDCRSVRGGNQWILNFLKSASVEKFVNKKAFQGTLLAHTDGNVPNFVVHLDKMDAYHLGHMIYFFEIAVGMSGYLNGVNPFNQPGVEAYKKNIFTLLGKPGYEELATALNARLNQ